MLNIQMNSTRNRFELSGLYKFRTDPTHSGEKERWFEGLQGTREIAVPASWNEQYQDLCDYTGTAWYECDAFVPHNWSGTVVKLRIGAAYYYSRVWINGEYTGEHEGGSLPFELDIAGLVQYGKNNKIVISVDAAQQPDRLPPGNFPQEEWVSMWQDQFPNNNYDFYPYGGIHRPVILYNTPQCHIDDIHVLTDIQGQAGKVNYTIKMNVQLETQQAKLKLFVNGSFMEEANIGKSDEIQGTCHIEHAILWDTENPYLYDFRFVIETEDGVLDEYNLPVGIRTIQVEGNQLLLNGKPVFLKGFGKHEEFAIIGKGFNHAVMIKDYNLLKWMGANSYRTSHYPYSEEMLDYADRNGILVIDETPLVGLLKPNFNASYCEKAKCMIKELVDRDKNHPSVIIWSVANEPTSNEPESEDFFKELYSYTKMLDKSRPVAMVNCLGIHEDRAIGHFDVICLNRYFGWYSQPGQLDEACRLLEEDLDACYEKFQKPVMITEFGADAIPGMHYDPPRQFTEEYQAEMLTRQYEIIARKPYTFGAHVWVFADFKTSQIYARVLFNHKGVFTRERQPKMAAHALRKLWIE